MKIVRLLAVVDDEKCIACRVCEKVCPVLAIKVENRLAVVNAENCMGCEACEQRCPTYAIKMIKREHPFEVSVDINKVDYAEIERLCRKAKFNPEQLICYCTTTRADELAAAILLGANTPEKLSLLTGARTGCKVECIEPLLRLLHAAGIKPEPPQDGWQWYGKTITAWEIPEEVKQNHASRGFYFEEDIELLDRVVAAPLQGRSES